MCSREKENHDMDIFTEALQFVLLLLLNCELRDCYTVTCNGELTLDRDIIPIGTNLTVHCRSNTVKCGRLFTMTFNEKEVLRKTSCSNVTARVVVNGPKSLIYCFVMQERKSHVVCGRDIIANPIPSRPQIKEMVFAKGSLSPIIHWYSTDNMENLKPSLRFRITHDYTDWMEVNVTELQRDTFVLLAKLEPLTLYEFELRVCTASMANNCSLWGETFSQSSPGKAPSTKLDVWRTIIKNKESNTQNVTVMWKPLGAEEFKGVLHHYEIVYQKNGTANIRNCSTALTQYTLQLPLEVTELNVSAVTSAGSSPPAIVRLTCSATQPSLCNISLYVESSDGVSCPTFKQIQMGKEGTDNIPTDLDKKVTHVEILKIKLDAEKTKNQLVVWVCVITAVPIIIIVNLKCTRRRLKKASMSIGPSWLFQNLPKLGNSNAMKLLKDERCGLDLYWQPVYNDPPLSPVEDYSPPVERKDLYPTVHREVTAGETMVMQDWTFCPYKPQITISQEAEAIEISEKEEDDPPWGFFSSPVPVPFKQLLPGQRLHAALPSCLTVDGRPVSMDLVDGFPFFTPGTLDETWTKDGRFAETGSGHQNQYKAQTVT